MNKTELDRKIQQVILLQQEIKLRKIELVELINELKIEYQYDPSVKEIITGIKYYMEKIPINLFRNKYNSIELITHLNYLRTPGIDNIIEYDINSQVLNKMVQEGIIDREITDLYRLEKWTFRSNFNKII